MPHSSRRHARQRQLFLESLESRRLLATFSPLPSTPDTAPGSLRATIIASNGNNQNDTINLNVGRYRLLAQNSGAAQENAAATGDLDLTDAGHTLTIQGKGAATVIDGFQLDRVFQVFPNVQLILKDLVVRNGLALDDGVAGHTSANSTSLRGGAILTSAGSSLTLTSVLIENCTAGDGSITLPAEGGAIYAGGAIVVTDSTFLDNQALAGTATATTTNLAQGGAIAAFGSTPLQISGSAFSENTAKGGKDGGAGAGLARGGAIASQVNVVISGSMFTGNRATAGENDTQFAGADGSGGALYVNGNATLTQSQFSLNSAEGGFSLFLPGVQRSGSGFGGAIFAKGMTVNQVTVDKNTAVGGPIFFGASEPSGATGLDGGRAAGGGIYLTANSSFTDLTLTANVADAGEGSIGLEGATGTDDNGGNGGVGGRADGGGLLAEGTASMSFTRLICLSNQALGGDGGNGGFADAENNVTAGGGGGAGIAVGGGLNGYQFTISDSTIGSNLAAAGNAGDAGGGRKVKAGTSSTTGFAGGIFAAGPATITASSILNNKAQGGEGGDGGYSSQPESSPIGGVGGNAVGGGLYTQNTVTLRNSTVSTNVAASGKGGGGGVAYLNGYSGGAGGRAQGGGIFVAGGTLNLRNSTIAKNNAAKGLGGPGGNGYDDGDPGADTFGQGGGVFNDGATVNASSSIFGDNSSGGTGIEFNGAFASASNNLLEHIGGATGIANNVNGNIVGKDALLGPLGKHGGPTQTHLLSAGSPAIDRGSNGESLTIDQRGLPRVVGVRIDIGAVEVQAPQVTLSGTVTYVENAAPLVLAASATVAAPDRANFNGGKLTITISANASVDDRLAIQNQGTGPGQISISGANVFYGGNLIGTFSGGSGSTPLVINFTTATSTPAAIQALVRAITFRNVSENPTTLTRSVTFVLADSGGLASNPANAKKSVKVTALPN